MKALRCWGEEIDLEMLTDFHVFSPPDYEVLFRMQSVYVWMFTSHAPERWDGFCSYSAFKKS